MRTWERTSLRIKDTEEVGTHLCPKMPQAHVRNPAREKERQAQRRNLGAELDALKDELAGNLEGAMAHFHQTRARGPGHSDLPNMMRLDWTRLTRKETVIPARRLPWRIGTWEGLTSNAGSSSAGSWTRIRRHGESRITFSELYRRPRTRSS